MLIEYLFIVSQDFKSKNHDTYHIAYNSEHFTRWNIYIRHGKTRRIKSTNFHFAQIGQKVKTLSQRICRAGKRAAVEIRGRIESVHLQKRTNHFRCYLGIRSMEHTVTACFNQLSDFNRLHCDSTLYIYTPLPSDLLGEA